MQSADDYTRKIGANKSEVIVKNLKDKTCLIIDVAIPADSNLIKRIVGKK